MRRVCMLLSATALSLVTVQALADPPDLSGVWLISTHVAAAKTVNGHAPPPDAGSQGGV
jgi:hypothetical protein